jgi:hypothetical protein
LAVTLAATTLTLPCHKVELRPVAARADLRTLFENACQGLSITPEQLQQQLEAGDDIPDLISGALTLKALRLTARTLALMRCSAERERFPDLNGKRTGG